MNIKSLGRKVGQAWEIGLDGAIAYVSNGINKVENSFRRRRVHELRADPSEVEDAVAAAIGVSNDAVRETTRAYDAVVERLIEFFSRPATADDTLTRVQYEVMRLVRPDRVLETGVWWGVSSAVILAALDENDRGHLYSIDMPPLDPKVRVEIGAAVPPELRSRWTLRLGPSRRILPELCAEMGSIDVFVHDSDHTYRCMRMEFKTVWPYLRPGGFLIADDVHTNDAFLEFVEAVGRPACVLPRRKGGYIGLIKK
jgi:predicted O-methyltransferase YrrM